MSTKEKIKEDVVVLEKKVNQHHIVLYNDEVIHLILLLIP